MAYTEILYPLPGIQSNPRELSNAEQERLISVLPESFETLFTEVVFEQSPGKWTVGHEAAERESFPVKGAEPLQALIRAPLNE